MSIPLATTQLHRQLTEEFRAARRPDHFQACDGGPGDLTGLLQLT
ncbi:hypothetical protein ACGFY7_49595 [Streptomyces prunicolor]